MLTRFVSRLFSSSLNLLLQHKAPVKTVNWVSDVNLLCTGSWDKNICYWDLRQSTPVSTVQQSERVYCADYGSPYLSVGLAERRVLVYDLRKPTVVLRVCSFTTAFSLALFPDSACALVL